MSFPRKRPDLPEIEDPKYNSIPPSSTFTIPPSIEGVDQKIEKIAENISALFLKTVHLCRKKRPHQSEDSDEGFTFTRSNIVVQLKDITTFHDIVMEINQLATEFRHAINKAFNEEAAVNEPLFIRAVAEGLNKTRLSFSSQTNMQVFSKKELKDILAEKETDNLVRDLRRKILTMVSQEDSSEFRKLLSEMQSYEQLKTDVADDELVKSCDNLAAVRAIHTLRRIVEICEEFKKDHGDGDYFNQLIPTLQNTFAVRQPSSIRRK